MITELFLKSNQIGRHQRFAALTANGDHFDKSLSKNPLKNFATENIRGMAKRPSKLCETRHERDMMGYILHLAIEKKMDVRRILSFPLTSAPPSIALHDGTAIYNEDKGEFANLLSPTSITEQVVPVFFIDIIDGFYFLSLRQNAPVKFGLYAEYILHQLCLSEAAEIFLIFAQYDCSSIRNIQAAKIKDLYDDGTAFEIKGPNQERPQNLRDYLRRKKFKTALVEFLLDYWAKNEDAINAILGTKRLFVTLNQNCYLFAADHEKKKCLRRFKNNHVTIESQIVMQIYMASQQKDILIQVQDTDSIIVNLLYHMQFWDDCSGIIVESGNATLRRRINVSDIYSTLSPGILQALPAWHTFCGNKYEPAFFGKRTKSTWKLFMKDSKFHRAFGNIGREDSATEEDIKVIECYTCQLYISSLPKLDDVNEARLAIFERHIGGQRMNKRNRTWNSIYSFKIF